MSESKKGFPGALADQGLSLAAAAVKRILDDPRGQGIVASAVGAAQKGKQRVDEVQERIVRAAGLATKGDLDDVARSMARLKRKLRDLSRQVDGQGKGGGGKR